MIYGFTRHRGITITLRLSICVLGGLLVYIELYWGFEGWIFVLSLLEGLSGAWVGLTLYTPRYYVKRKALTHTGDIMHRIKDNIIR